MPTLPHTEHHHFLFSECAKRFPFLYLLLLFLVILAPVGAHARLYTLEEREAPNDVFIAPEHDTRAAQPARGTPASPTAAPAFKAVPNASGVSSASGSPLNASGPSDASNSAPAAAEQPGLLARFAARVTDVWNSPTYDLYLPLYTWHNRLMYDTGKTSAYNEHPWGGGIGRSLYDEDGDWHALYAMGFSDSHSKFEPIVGYGFLKNHTLDDAGDWRAGVGYTLGITARHEYDYVPLPLPLPMAGIEYKRFALQAVYIPGLYNDGNVLFVWARWQMTE